MILCFYDISLKALSEMEIYMLTF